MNYDWIITIKDVGWTTLRDVYIYRKTFDGVELLTDKGVKTIKNGSANQEPTIRLEPEQLQAFADALNDNGYKAQKGYLEGKVEATEKHLEDMRKLVFNPQLK